MIYKGREIPLTTSEFMELHKKSVRAYVAKRPVYIYKITCEPTGKEYIGHAINPEARFKAHMSGLEPHKYSDDLERFGPDSFKFEIIEVVGNLYEADATELRHIIERDAVENGYNTRATLFAQHKTVKDICEKIG